MAVVATGGVIYLRVFRGWKLLDMMYVTRASLKQSVGHLSEGEQGVPHAQGGVMLDLRSLAGRDLAWQSYDNLHLTS